MWRKCSRSDWILQGFAAAAACAVLTVLIGWKIVNRWLDEPLPVGAAVLVELPEGGNLTSFLDDLRERGLIAHPHWLRAQARLSGVADRVRAGEYNVQPGMTPRSLLQALVAGKVVVYTVTLVEGMTVEQVLARLHQQPKLKRTLPGATASSLAVDLKLGETWKSAEGAFFPDTYQYSLGMSDADILYASSRALERVLREEWEGRDPAVPYASPYEALIMASLVEKETALPAERPEIAGVFVRRIRQGMLLQTDPAVIYGLGSTFEGNLTREHLRAPGAYNTYLNPGLPPSPIALPGREAINAALHPAPGTALYFVARGDGSHEFSDTLEEHNRAVRKYQLRRRVRGEQSPTHG